MTAMGRIRSFVTVCEFSSPAICYAELNGRDRPRAHDRNSVVRPKIDRTMDFKPFKNLSFWIPALLSVAFGIGLAIAETKGFAHSSSVFQALAIMGVVYFVGVAFVLPYKQLRIVKSGFTLTTQTGRHNVEWEDVVEVQVLRDNHQLEWIIKTQPFGLVCIFDDEYLYRRRLRKSATEHLHNFDDEALQQAIDSRTDGSWTCYPKVG